MGSNSLKLILAEVHILAGLAAVGTLAATGHLDSTVAAGFIGGLLGIGGTAPLVAYSPLGEPQAPQAGQVPPPATRAASGVQAAGSGPSAVALTPGEVTGTATQSAMPASP